DADGNPTHAHDGESDVWPGNAAIALDRWLDLVHPEDQERVSAGWKESVATGAELHLEYRARRPDGEWRNLVGHAVPVRDAAGKVLEWVGVLDDVTEITQATSRLHE